MKNVFLIAVFFLAGLRLPAQPCDSTIQLQGWTAHLIAFAPDEIPDILNVDVLDPNTIWATSQALNYLRSTDGGCTWQKGTFDDLLDPELVYSNQILGIDSSTAWISLYDDEFYKSHLYKTVNGGRTWTDVLTTEYSADDSYLNDIYFFNATDGILLGDVVDGYFEIYTTTNNGDTWTRVPQQNFPPLAPGESGFSANVYAVVGDTIWVPTYKAGRIMRSTDKGYHWEVFDASPVNENGPSAIEFRDARHGLYMSKLQGAWKTADGGSTWNPVTAPPEWGRFLENIPGTTFYLYTYGPSKALITFDEGDHWYDIQGGYLHEIDFIDSVHGWAGGTGQILKYDPLTPAKEPDVAVDWYKIFPNPTSDNCRVYFSSLPSEPYYLEVYRADGCVLSAQQGSGQDAIVDLARLPNGVYFLKIVCGQRMANVPVIKF